MNQSHMYETVARPGRFVVSCVELSTEGSDKLGQSPLAVVWMYSSSG